jgi:hypothetical protein
MNNMQNLENIIKKITTTPLSKKQFGILFLIMAITNPSKDKALDYHYSYLKEIDFRGVCVEYGQRGNAECYYKIEKMLKDKSRMKTLIENESEQLNLFIINFTLLRQEQPFGYRLYLTAKKEIPIEGDYSGYYSSYFSQYPSDFGNEKTQNISVVSSGSRGWSPLTIGVLGVTFGYPH